TPERKAFSGSADYVEIPGSEGELGVYPNHVPLLGRVVPGELRVVKDGKATPLAIGEGFVEITASSISVLTDMAMHENEIDEAAVEEAMRRAQAALSEKHSVEEVATAQASLLKSLAQLKVKRKRH
ncbi:MAG: ATP synthase F1 subunit epsilon, partial [Verrucomicrobiae bacterium]|nr:ATP synthase F1 subunit epsilon [Verrucomicrobiae bacterium]